MFSPDSAIDGSRALIASGDAEKRRLAGEVAKAAGLRAVGFIRDSQQVYGRSSLSAPDVLLLDIRMLVEMQEAGVDIQQLNGVTGRVVIFRDKKSESAASCSIRIEGLNRMIDLDCQTAEAVEVTAQKLRQALGASVAPRQAIPLPAAPLKAALRNTMRPISVVIGSSTGGPVALMEVLKSLPGDLPLPVAVVQHMPPGFTRMLAERLDTECALKVMEAENGLPFEAGTVYIAPGGYHMVLEGTATSVRVQLNKQPPENSCRPAVDVLFRSSAKVYGGRQHVIVLTGMGRDGLLGATELHGLGSRIVVQDAATSTVWGMPGAIAQAGIADDILPLNKIASHLMRCL